MNIEDCGGCVIEDKNLDCAFFSNEVPCPCMDCLIKMMCNTPCDILYDHRDFIQQTFKRW